MYAKKSTGLIGEETRLANNERLAGYIIDRPCSAGEVNMDMDMDIGDAGLVWLELALGSKQHCLLSYLPGGCKSCISYSGSQLSGPAHWKLIGIRK